MLTELMPNSFCTGKVNFKNMKCHPVNYDAMKRFALNFHNYKFVLLLKYLASLNIKTFKNVRDGIKESFSFIVEKFEKYGMCQKVFWKVEVFPKKNQFQFKNFGS